MSEQFQYGFRVDPMTWINESDSVQAAQVRTLLLNDPKDGDEAILAAEIDRLLADQHADGSLGDDNTTGKLIRLSRLGCSPDRPEVQAAVEYICRDEERGGDGRLGCYGLYVAEWVDYHDAELIARSTRRLASQVMTMDFSSLCPWGGQVHTRGMWSGRGHADIAPALDRGMHVMLSDVQEGKGWPGFLDPFGFLDAAAVIDHPLSRQIVIKQIPLILRTQQADGTWGGEKHLGYGPDSATYVVLRALIKHGLLDALREAPPLPPDWEIVRPIPAPEGDLSMLAAGGGRLWVYDKATGEAVGISTEDGAERTRVKLPSDIRRIGWQDGELAVIRVVEFVEDDWDVEGLVLLDPDGDRPPREAPMSEWRGGGAWHINDFEGGPPVLEKGGPDADWGEAPFGKNTAGVATDGDDLWVLDSDLDRICLIEKTDSGRALTVAPAASTRRGSITLAQRDVVYDIPRLDDAAFGDDWAGQGFRVDVFSQLSRGAPQFRDDSIYMFRPLRTALAMAWNADGLLLHLAVDDDKAVEADTDEALWENNGDCILLYVAPQPGVKAYRRVVIAPGMSDDQPAARALCNESLTPPEDLSDEAFRRVDANDDSAVRVLRTKTDSGYALDILVPWADLDIEPAAGDEIGLQLILLDRDTANPNAPLAGAMWYPSLGARQDTRETHRVRLSKQAGPKVTAVLENGPGRPLDIAVTASGDLAGKIVTVVDGDRTLAEAVLMADELSGYAIGSIPLPLAAASNPKGTTTIVLNGRTLATLNRVTIDGVPSLGWGKYGDTTFAGALASALSVTEHPYTYAQIMGYSGLAFRFRWGPRDHGWCPSVPVGEFPEEKQAVAWATGWDLRDEDNMANEDNPQMQRFADDVVASIDAGMPVVGYAPDMNCAVAFGYDNDGASFLWWDYFGGDTPVVLSAEKTGPWLWFLEGFSAPPSRREQLLASLKIAVRNWYRELDPDRKPEQYYYLWGEVALAAWQADIRDAATFTEEQQAALFFANWWCFEILVDARNSAAAFLREYADAADSDQAAQHLRKAADLYQQEGQLLGAFYGTRDAFMGPWSGKSAGDWTDEVRRREVEAISQAHELDSQAIAEIEAALTAMEPELDDPVKALDGRSSPGEDSLGN